MQFKLKIVSHKGIFFEGEVQELILRTADGYAGILPNHSPIISSILPSVLKISQDNKLEEAIISSGFIYLSPNDAQILADEIIWKKDIDLQKAKKELENARKKLLESKDKRDEILIRKNIEYFTWQLSSKKDKI